MTGEDSDAGVDWPSADEVATTGGPVRSVATDGGDDRPWITLPVLLDVPPEVWERIRTHARARAQQPGAPDDLETVFSDALNEYIQRRPIVVVDGEVRDASDVFDAEDGGEP